MRLSKAEIVNFRSIENVDIEFDPTCRVLVGINESGKSNILKALALLQPEIKPIRKDDVREALQDEEEITDAHIRFYLRLEKSETDKLRMLAAKQVLSKSSDPILVVSKGVPKTLSETCAGFTDVRYYVDLLEETKSFRWANYGTDTQIAKGWKKPTKFCPSDFKIDILGKTVTPAELRLIDAELASAIPPTYLADPDVSDVARLIGSPAISLAETTPIKVISWIYDERNLLPSQISIDTFSGNPDTCTPLKNMFELAGITDISGELTRVKTLSHNQAQNFFHRIASKTTQQFRLVWNEYATVEFTLRLDADKIVPGIKEQNSYDFSKRSDGFKRFVTFLLMISLNVANKTLKDTLLIIDEPDYGLHPTGSRYLKDELIRISDTNYVVFSTHSIFMIDTGHIDRHYIVKKNKEITRVEVAKESNIADEEVLYNALGFSLFEILKGKNLIFEGWRDKRLFQVAIPKASSATKKVLKDVGVCHAKGTKHIKAITPMIELAKRSCVVLSDSDQPAKDQQKLFKKDRVFGDWRTYQEIDDTLTAVTGEDFIKKPFFIAQLLLIAQSKGLPNFPEGELPVSGRISTIEAWLREQGLDDQQAKDFLNEFKSMIFEKLAGKDVEEDYQKFLDGVAKLANSE